MLKNLKRVMLTGLGAATVAGALAAATSVAAADGDNHYSRRHPDSYAYRDPAYDAGGVVAGAGEVAGGALAGAGDVVAGTVGGVAGTVAGVTDPNHDRPYAGYDGGGRVYHRSGQSYYRRGAYYYPTGGYWVDPRDGDHRRADGRWDWGSGGGYRYGTPVRGNAPNRADYDRGNSPDDF